MDLTSRLEYYRARAAEAEESLVTDPIMQVTYLHVAKSWIHLAEHTEKREAQRQA
jgi:hypothetical protein